MDDLYSYVLWQIVFKAIKHCTHSTSSIKKMGKEIITFFKYFKYIREREAAHVFPASYIIHKF